MTPESLRELLRRFRSGELSEDAALEELARMPFRELRDARVDTHRALRQGLPEVVLGLGKSVEQICEIVKALESSGVNVLVTRVEPQAAHEVRRELPQLEHRPEARLLWLAQQPPHQPSGQGESGSIAVVTAGTADSPVAEEAAVVAELFGNKVERLYDVGVAGLHRLLASIDVLRSARVLIVVAGMEGALPSVVGGLVGRPVIAVPTSVGYGTALGGVTALLGMLASCASNVTAVNIDNGFGAAFVATLINRG
jgi:NCAIR mutase (PurE)-related protein